MSTVEKTIAKPDMRNSQELERLSSDYNNIIPKPRMICKRDAQYQRPEKIHCFSDFNSDNIDQALADIAVADTGNAENAELLICRVDQIAGVENPSEAYTLKIDSKQITIQAVNECGAFYGIKTLKQILNQRGAIDQVEITDWPDLEMRAMHMTLGSGNMPTFDRFKKIIPTYADYKLNTFIIEYDDRFPWEKHPAIVHPDALSKEQIRELVALAKDNFIEVIPLLDSLGHAQQYLKHEEYAHLRELPNETAEMCASNPATMKFIKELWEEVLELHPDSRFAHITGDEVFRMGDFCPKCRKYADSGKLAELFTIYYQELSEWIIAKGKKPIIWGDMLIKYPEYIDKFSRNIYINDWTYYGIDSNYWNFCMNKCNPEGKTSKERDNVFNPYWHQDDPEKFTPYPFFKFFKDNGFKTLAATAVGREGNTKYPVSSSFCRFANNKRFAETAVNNGGEGLVATLWSGSGMLEASWFGILAGADFSWHSRPEEYGEFAKRFSASFLNMSEKFAKDLMVYDKRLYKEMPGFITGREAIINDEKLVYESSDSLTSISKSYLNILSVVDTLNKFDNKLQLIYERVGTLFIGKGEDTVITLDEVANSNIQNCMPSNAPSFKMKSGEKNIWGVKFKIDSSLLITIAETENHISPIKINDKYDKLLFVNTCHSAQNGKTIAIMRVKYVDGSVVEVPLIAGKNTADWWRWEKNTETALPAWQGTTENGCGIAAYLTAWDNPDPGKTIKSLIFESVSEGTRMVVFSLTGRRNTSVECSDEIVAELKNSIDSLTAELAEKKESCRRVYTEIMSKGDMETAIKKLFGQRIEKLEDIKKKLKRIEKKWEV